MCPLLSAARQAVGQTDPLPGQQAVRTELCEQGGVKDAVGGLSQQQTTPQQVEVIQRCQEAWETGSDSVERKGSWAWKKKGRVREVRHVEGAG